MEISADTKIDNLLKEYPFLEDFMVDLSPKFKGLKNPIMRKTIGKVATLSKVAGIGGLDLEDFLTALTKEIERQADKAAAPDESTSDETGSVISDSAEKQAALKEIIKALHAGEDMAVLKQRFSELVKGVQATEIARMEQALIWTRACPLKRSNACATSTLKYLKRRSRSRIDRSPRWDIRFTPS